MDPHYAAYIKATSTDSNILVDEMILLSKDLS